MSFWEEELSSKDIDLKIIEGSEWLTGVCKKILKAKKLLTRNFRRWKRAGKPASKTHPIRKSYMSSRSDLQNMQRNKENLIKQSQ